METGRFIREGQTIDYGPQEPTPRMALAALWLGIIIGAAVVATVTWWNSPPTPTQRVIKTEIKETKSEPAVKS